MMLAKICPKCKATQLYEKKKDGQVVCHECYAEIPRDQSKPSGPYLYMDKYGRSRKRK